MTVFQEAGSLLTLWQFIMEQALIDPIPRTPRAKFVYKLQRENYSVLKHLIDFINVPLSAPFNE